MNTLLNRLPVASIPKDYESLVRVHIPRPIHDQNDYDNTCEVIDWLSGHELNSEQEDYLEALSLFISDYESKQNSSLSTPSGIETLQFLLRENQMSGTDLAQLLECHQSIASRILSGARSLKPVELKKLSKRFHVSIECFV